MKQQILSFLIIFSAILANAQEVLPTQQTLVTKVTATWCYHCGTWGWEAQKDLIAENPNNAVFIGAHYSGALRSTAATEISKNFGSIGQPQWFVNNQNARLFQTTAEPKKAEIQTSIKDNALQTAIANTGVLYELDGSVLNTTIKTKFFQPADGDYYLGVYLLESGVQEVQEGQIGLVSHDNVLRGAFTRSSFGNSLHDGTIETDTEFTQDFSMILPPSWNTSNMKVLTIIWKKEGTTYQVVNSLSTPLTGTTNIVSPEPPSIAVTDFNAYPWLMELVDTENCCNNKGITVYNSGAHQYVFVAEDAVCSPDKGTLYFQDGTFYCSDSPAMDCLAAYRLTEANIASQWTCDGPSEMPSESEPPVEDMMDDSETIDFINYPWLAEIVDTENCCANKNITIYNSGAYQFLYVESDLTCADNIGTLYFQDGTFYCADSPGMDCRSAYNLEAEAIASSWSCGAVTEDTNTDHTDMEEEEEEEEVVVETEPETASVMIEGYPWLQDLINAEDCCTTQIIAYTVSTYSYIYIEQKADCETASQLYFQDGTFYCQDSANYDCRAAYQLEEASATVLWTCGQ